MVVAEVALADTDMYAHIRRARQSAMCTDAAAVHVDRDAPRGDR